MERSEYTVCRTKSYHPSDLPGVEQDPAAVLVGHDAERPFEIGGDGWVVEGMSGEGVCEG
jgi:hypothetical protein